jgi:hypothetical protein
VPANPLVETFAPAQLGRVAPAYAGRGRVRNPAEQVEGPLEKSAGAGPARGQSIAARRAARQAEENAGADPQDPGGSDRVAAGRGDNTRRDV